MFVLVGRVLIKHGKRSIDRAKDDRKKMVKNTLKTLLSIISVMLMFGLTWLFGALSISGAAYVFQWLFILCATTQGFILFVFFCIIGSDAREEWKRLLSCYRYKGTKQRATPSTVSSKSKGKTYQTSLSSRKMASDTIRKMASDTIRKTASDTIISLMEKAEPSFDSSAAALEMNDFSPPQTNLIDSIMEEDSSLVITNDLGDAEKPEVIDSEIPPQVVFRLKRSHYDLQLVEEQDSRPPSTSPNLSNTCSQLSEILEESDNESLNSTLEL